MIRSVNLELARYWSHWYGSLEQVQEAAVLSPTLDQSQKTTLLSFQMLVRLLELQKSSLRMSLLCLHLPDIQTRTRLHR